MCVFCKIINGEIPSKKLYEDDDVISILDISQATLGHSLIIPKKHFDNLLDIEENYLNKCVNVAKKVAGAIYKTYDVKGFNMLQNTGSAAGQSVNHFHIHIIPRYDNDNLIMKFSENKYDLDDIKNNIIKNI